MTQYDNTDKGALFRNERKQSETHPDMTGKINIGGVDRYLSAWTKVGKNGSKFLSLSIGKPVDGAESKPAKAGPDVGDGDNMPW